jgi:hypothetical protein
MDGGDESGTKGPQNVNGIILKVIWNILQIKY